MRRPALALLATLVVALIGAATDPDTGLARLIVLELRVSNVGAKGLYKEAGYSLVNRLRKYYSDGEDCFLMVKSLV